MAVLALAALILAVSGRRARKVRRGEAVATDTPGQAEAGSPTRNDSESVPQQETVAFLAALGKAMVDSGDPVTHIQDTLRRVAETNGVSATGIVVLPTALIVSLPGEREVLTSVTVAGVSPLRLDQVDAVYAVADSAARGRLGPREGLSALQAASTSSAPFSTPATVVGHVVLTVGLAIILGGKAIDLAVAAVLGAAVGLARVATRRVTFAYQVFVPVLSAFVVATVVFLLPRTGLDVGVLAPLIAPLVMFLPGALLTTSVIELATGQMVSGASRLVAGLMQLTLLALGILVAAQLVGTPAIQVSGADSSTLNDLAPWLGVAVFGVGVVVHRCARRRAAGWILLVLYVAYAGQVLGGFLLGGALSAFTGALLMTPVAVYVATLPSGPATMVSFLPAFWLLVPGALGLVGLTQVLGPSRVSGFESLLTTGAAMIGIAFGVLLGLAAATGLESLARLGPRGRYAGQGTTAGQARVGR
ncbi:threonine/serine ThrE exporter family protein [Angustibacter sp. McL0619]|uniref:threonine/serine ThrE exporter family protein n=1 Tax=Angustibacter sp. McL0619 TaxID=3415676 RepID=UPI003CE90A7A